VGFVFFKFLVVVEFKKGTLIHGRKMSRCLLWLLAGRGANTQQKDARRQFSQHGEGECNKNKMKVMVFPRPVSNHSI
jgi:hypothetical protein